MVNQSCQQVAITCIEKLTLCSPVIVAKISRSSREVDATSNKASFGQSKNQSIVVQFNNAGYCLNRTLYII